MHAFVGSTCLSVLRLHTRERIAIFTCLGILQTCAIIVFSHEPIFCSGTMIWTRACVTRPRVCARALCASLTRAHEQDESLEMAAAMRAMRAASGLYEFEYSMSNQLSDLLPGAVGAATNGEALDEEVCLD